MQNRASEDRIQRQDRAPTHGTGGGEEVSWWRQRLPAASDKHCANDDNRTAEMVGQINTSKSMPDSIKECLSKILVKLNSHVFESIKIFFKNRSIKITRETMEIKQSFKKPVNAISNKRSLMSWMGSFLGNSKGTNQSPMEKPSERKQGKRRNYKFF